VTERRRGERNAAGVSLEFSGAWRRTYHAAGERQGGAVSIAREDVRFS